MERVRHSPFRMVKYELLYDVNRIFMGGVTRIFVKDTTDFNHLRWDEKNAIFEWNIERGLWSIV